MSRGSTWTNSDGLVVGFGTHSEDNNVAAVTQSSGGKVTLKQEITLADVSWDAFAATNADPQAVRIPRGSIITSAYLVTKVAAVSGGGGTLDIGTWGVGLTTEVADDPNGIVDAVSVAEMSAVGEVHICDGGLVNASGNTAAAGESAACGVTSNSDVIIAPSYDTAVFTAGVVLLHLEYIPPSGSAGRTLAV